MRPKSCRLIVSIVSLATLPLFTTRELHAGDSPTWRRWSDRTGSHAVNALYAGYSDGAVLLRKKGDDSTVAVPLSLLSQADKKYVIEMVRRKSLTKRVTPAAASPVAELEKRVASGDSKRLSPERLTPDRSRLSRRREDAQPARAEDLFGIRWQNDPKRLLAEANDQEKPIVWFRVLGELDGFM